MSIQIYRDGKEIFDLSDVVTREEYNRDMASLSIELAAIKQLITQQQPDPVFNAIVLSPGENIQAAILDAKAGQDILLRAGTYVQKMRFLESKPGLHLKPYPGDEGKVIVDGRIKPDWTWTKDANYHEAAYPGFAELWHFTAGGDPRLPAGDKQKHYPVLATIGKEKIKWATSPALSPGEFWISSVKPHEPGRIYVKLKEGQSMDDFRISPFPWLIGGEDNCVGIQISDIKFQYCSGTGKDGMISTPGFEWKLTNIEAWWADSIGIEVGGQKGSSRKSTGYKHVFTNCLSSYAGQLSWWGSGKECQFIRCEGSFANQDGYYLWWEAGHKLEDCTDCYFENWRAIGNKAHGFWFDIGNTNNTMAGGYFENNVGTAITVEHYSSHNQFSDIIINNTVPKESLKAGHGVLIGIYILSSADYNDFEGGKVINCEDGVRFNTKDPRSPAAKGNEVAGFEFIGCDNKVKFDGPDDGTNKVI